MLHSSPRQISGRQLSQIALSVRKTVARDGYFKNVEGSKVVLTLLTLTTSAINMFYVVETR